ncbi:hypothetical protein ACO0M4_11880 [Streptomyces sp. RGM 3693]|uniref:hypothetical protein n=1 Tax=Streptomyces sp. RGM 3693 TaxID=3413284 RepID=UPI003D28D173
MSEIETLRAAIHDELDSLWTDLSHARNRALRGQWSMECDFLVERIKKLTKLVDPIPWRSIDDLSLVEDGIYQRVHAELGVDAPVDMAAVAQARMREKVRKDRMLQRDRDRHTQG